MLFIAYKSYSVSVGKEDMPAIVMLESKKRESMKRASRELVAIMVASLMLPLKRLLFVYCGVCQIGEVLVRSCAVVLLPTQEIYQIAY